MVEASSAGERSRRSEVVTPGKSQYIIPMPEGNHRKKNRQSATPSHRWTTIAICLAGTWNGLSVTSDSSDARGWLRAGFPRQLLQEGVVIGLATCERDGHGPFDGMTPLTFGS